MRVLSVMMLALRVVAQGEEEPGMLQVEGHYGEENEPYTKHESKHYGKGSYKKEARKRHRKGPGAHAGYHAGAHARDHAGYRAAGERAGYRAGEHAGEHARYRAGARAGVRARDRKRYRQGSYTKEASNRYRGIAGYHAGDRKRYRKGSYTKEASKRYRGIAGYHAGAHAHAGYQRSYTITEEPAGCAPFEGAPNLVEDCTHKDFFVWKGSKTGFAVPSYNPIYPRYGSDANWTTVKVQEGIWQGLCVAYVLQEGRGTCDAWCDGLGLQCVRAMNDANEQREALSDWLEEQGSVATNCTLYPAGAQGCQEEYETQICACEAVA